MKKLIIYILFLHLHISVYASGNEDTSKIFLGALPSFSASPETKLSLGALVYTYFQTDKLSRLSNAQSYISYTLNKQYSIENDISIWFNKDLSNFSAALDFIHFPEFFFGLGNNTKLEDRVLTSFDLIRIHIKGIRQISRNKFIGLASHYENLYNLNMPLKSSVDCRIIDGGNGYNVVGAGPVFVIDKRNNPLNPTKGVYFESTYQQFRNLHENNQSFKYWLVDFRKFDTLFYKIVWNGSIYYQGSVGNVPYRMLPTLGGAKHLRGYYKGRFRDMQMLVIQQELRRTIYGRFGIALFAGMGATANKLSAFPTTRFHYGYGGGIRFKLVRKQDTNLRIDYGITKDSQGIYIVFAEAF